jgi:hypothetical protein
MVHRRRRDLNQFGDLLSRQPNLKVLQGYGILHDRSETDDLVRRQHLPGKEFIALPPSGSFRYAGKLGITPDCSGVRIHPLDCLAVGPHESNEHVLALLQGVGSGDDYADRLTAQRRDIVCVPDNTNFALLDFIDPEWRCRPECGWDSCSAISSNLTLSDQAARSIW